MRVIQPKPPLGRLTTVELTDVEVQLISRALYKDDPTGSLAALNRTLNDEFVDLRQQLGLPTLVAQ